MNRVKAMLEALFAKTGSPPEMSGCRFCSGAALSGHTPVSPLVPAVARSLGRFWSGLPLFLLTLGLILPAVPAAAESIDEQRLLFPDARQALNKNDLPAYRHLRIRLEHYPLSPYLDIWHAYKQLEEGDDEAVLAVLRNHAAIPEALDLHMDWIRSLARRGQWPQVAKHLNDFSGAAARLSEIAMVSCWRTGKKDEAMKQFSLRWQQGRRISDFTVPLHQAWKQQGHPTIAERWERIATLATQGKWRRVKRLAKPFSEKEKGWIKYWQSVQNDPATALAQWRQDIPAKLARRIMSDGLKRLSRKDELEAWERLHAFDNGVVVSQIGEKAFAAFERSIALRAAKRHLLLASLWLSGLPAAKQNEETRAWLVRLHLLYRDWQKVIDVIEAMPAAERRQSRWIYWRGRALEQTGRKDEAMPLFAELAQDRGYYSFLSAERLGLPLRFDATEIEAPAALVQEISRRPAIIRAHEWLQLDKARKALREWNTVFAGETRQMWMAAANIAATWGWHARAIQAAYQAGRKDALYDRFPLAYQAFVLAAAKETGLEPELIWSIIRQESAFNHQAVSRAGARGLMQLMPATAREVARKNKQRVGDLFSPERNIRFGSFYLSRMLERFDGNPALAAAAYNAGPRRVGEWLERTRFESAEIWIEAIPFNETRRYVQQVMAFASVYEWRQAKPVSSISERISSRAEGVNLSLNR